MYKILSAVMDQILQLKEFELNEVHQALIDLPSSSSPGQLGIHGKVLKAMPDILCPILLQLFNSCLEFRKIPDDWKIAVVTPLFKNKGEKSDINNYRAISVLSPLAKIFEKLIAKQISNYFESNSLFFKGQHGFRSGFSCQTAIHEYISDINSSLDRKLLSLSLFIDFKKAFDLVDPNLLLLKLFHYGFDNNSLGLLTDYFRDRFQVVKIGDCVSNKGRLKLGVPQGSVLGPLFFLIFINDLSYLLEDVSLKQFADDTTVTKSGKTLELVIDEFEGVFENLTLWCNFNKVEINWSKTYFMVFSKKKYSIPDFIQIKNIKIKVVQEIKLLGFIIDCNLNFVKLATSVCITVNKKLFSIKRLFYLCTSVKIQFFKTFILPYFDYIFTILCYFSKEAIQKLSNCFYISIYKLLKIKLNFNDINEVNNILEKYGLFAFQHRALERMINFSYKIINFSQSPPILREQFVRNKSRNLSYNLRNGNNFVETSAKTRNGEKTFGYFYTRLANQFVVNREGLKLSTFKNSIFNNINLIFNDAIKTFDKFNLNFKFCYFVFLKKN